MITLNNTEQLINFLNANGLSFQGGVPTQINSDSRIGKISMTLGSSYNPLYKYEVDLTMNPIMVYQFNSNEDQPKDFYYLN